MDKRQINELKKALKGIKDQPVNVENIDTYLDENQIPKSSKVKNLECSIMFVDMRHSTDMTDNNGRKNMVKIYKMFAMLVVKAVEENEGHVAQIMGDGMLCIFVNGSDNSGQLAINAATSINTYLSMVYNQIVGDDWKISCGIGIRTGHVYITKVGIKGKKKCSKVVYPSSITNYASKLCDEADGGEILFDNTTYSQLDKSTKRFAKGVPNEYLGRCKSMRDIVWEIKK